MLIVSLACFSGPLGHMVRNPASACGPSSSPSGTVEGQSPNKTFVSRHLQGNARNRWTEVSIVRLLLSAVLMIFFASAVAWGGVTGSISGTVKDPSGAVVPGATVTALQTETGIQQTTHTDAQGFYTFPLLPVGHYEINVQQTGFKEFHQSGLVIDVNSALRTDVTLEVGAVTQSVNVHAAAVQVETTNTQMGELIGSTKIETIPLNGRSYTDLLALQPGVVPISSGETSAIPVSGGLNGGALSVSGQRESANGFMVNGANVEEGVNNGTAIIPNLDSIAEFRIITNNFDAEYGNYSGGQVNAVTKSGTNQVHGDLFEFVRNTDLDARNYFSPDRGTFQQNQFGGTVGGPIKHDKVFYFADYQGSRQILGVATGLIPVPSQQDHQGNLSDVASQLKGTVGGSYWANTLSQELGYTVTPGEPYYTAACTPSTQCVFPNAVIPQAAFSAPAQALHHFVPPPNFPGGYYSTSAFKQTLPDNKGSGRIDATTRLGMISGYYFIDDYDLNSPYPVSGATLPGFSAATEGGAQLFTMSVTKAFGGNSVNEFRLNYVRDANNFTKPIGGVGQKLSSYGFVEGPNTLGVVAMDPADEGVPPTLFTNYQIGVAAFPKVQKNNTYQLLDNFSKVKGTHTLKFGVDLHYDQINIAAHAFSNGDTQFFGGETGVDFADFLIGAPSVYAQGVQFPIYNRGKYAGLFAEDSWRARSDLTLNFGVRWDYTTPWYEKYNHQNVMDPGVQSATFPGSPVGWIFPGDAGIPRTVAPTPLDDFAPRIGLAYSPKTNGGFLEKIFGGSGKSSLRAGFGMFYTATEDQPNFNQLGDAPFGSFYVNPVPPLYATPFVDRATGNSEGQRFPPPLPKWNASPSNPDNTINWAQFLPIGSSPAYFQGNRTPYSEEYEFSFQRQFGSSTLLTASYIGTQGHRLLSALESNPGIAALCLSVSQISQVAPGGPTCGPFGENGVYTTASGQVINGTRAPLGPAFASNNWYINMGNSNYNALQMSLRHAVGRLEFLAGYSYSKSLDNASGYGDQINPFNYKASKSLSAFDMTQNFVLSYRYELPFDKIGGPNRLSKGWVITGVTRFTTGLPVTMVEVDDNSLSGTAFAGNNPVDTPDYTPGNLQFNNPRSGQPYFNAALFAPEQLGQLGSASRRFFHGPGLNNFDLALLKDLRLTESMSFQFRAEFFNVFNHAQFLNPIGNIDSTSFGDVTGAANPRIGQFAVKFLF